MSINPGDCHAVRVLYFLHDWSLMPCKPLGTTPSLYMYLLLHQEVVQSQMDAYS